MFNTNYVEQLKKEHLSGKENHSHRLWSMMVFGIWQDLYLRGASINEKAIQTSSEFVEV